MEPKVFNDPIHGQMEFHPFLVKIIDTPQFQRLRYLKQLGGGYFIYPGASHNRFEHSLGVAHLARRLVRSLRENQPELGITDRDILCVQIAGLCHDLGHGPFSHMFDDMFMPLAKPKAGWKHEKGSVEMFDHIVDYLKGHGFDLKSELKNLSKNDGDDQSENSDSDDLEFIKEMINGPKEKGRYTGRPSNKSFLYEIVSNKRNGLDVDKFDYLGRDCHHLGIKNGFDHNRYIMFARVIEVDGRLQICTRDKEVPNIYEMFHTRSSLHRKACQHKINKVIQLMIRDALLKADEKLKISKAIDNMEEYIKVTDSVFEKILYSTEDELKGAREILQNILSRKLYRCLGETKLTDELATEKEQWTSEMTSINKQGHTENDFEIKFKKKWKSELAAMPTYKEEEQLIENNFEIIITTFDFGKKEKNPMDNLYVYNKFDNEKAFKIPSEQVFQFLLPNRFSEKWISVYYTSWDKKAQGIAQKNFYEWCQRKNLYLSPSPPQLLTVDQQPKAFRDNVHGQVEFHPFLVKIIDTPQFQRLRYLKQLGCAYFVYPGASHNRFEHSLGVAHLAGQFVRSLKEKQGELGITDRDILCVQIAGLCHDLGHGPFSHMFDDMFMPLAKPKAGWKHEKGSVEMFDHIVDYLKGHDFDLKSELKNLSKNDGDDQSENSDSDDLEFIKEMINGPKEKGRYTGRPSNKSFLYEIVSNKRNGVGVDKFDYFARDCHHLGIKNGFDHNRYIMFARVIEVDGRLQICTRDKEVPNIYEMFHTRSSLHRKVYQHKTNKAIELMIRDALLKADEKLKISKAIDNMEEYIKVTDSVFEKILYSTEDELKGAREILQNILSRKLYRCLGETKWTDELAKKVKDLEKENIEILITTFDFGQKEENPMDKLYVYKKSDNKKALPIEQVSQFLLPYKFSEKWIRAYCKSCDSDTLTKAQDMFKKWKQPSSESTSVAN